MSAYRSVAAAVLGLFICGLSFAAEGEPATVTPQAPVGAAGGGDTARSRLEKLIATAPVKGVPQRLGLGVMVKYTMRLEDGTEKGFKTIFKPRQSGSQSFTYEIAAYRIDRLCHMGHVPVTVKRALPRSLLAEAGGSGFGRIIFSGDLAGGSLQQWINGAHDPTGSAARSWALTWLARLENLDDELPDRDMGRQVGDMFLLDYLQGNTDRFSGGNILEDPEGTLWFIDNASSFEASPRLARDFDRIRRFDRTVTDALRHATEEDFTREVGPWISDEELSGLLGRRRHVLDRVEAVVDGYGEDEAYIQP